ncbi:MAG TPA: S41 family peptidase, partial [Chitinophaga sp.]
ADTSGMKAVCWQHNGYGIASKRALYQSVRANGYIKQTVPNPSRNLSFIDGSISAKPYRDLKVRFSAAIKALDLGEGTAQLWLEVERTDSSTGFFENMRFRPFTGVNKAWRRDTITGKVDSDGQTITFGCFIRNKGRLLIDDIKLEIQTDKGWETVRVADGDFESDTLDMAPADWHFNASDRYFTVKTTDQQAITGKHALYLERKNISGGTETTAPLFSTTLPAGSVIRKDIGSGLSITMPVALWGDGDHTYPLTDTAQTILQNNAIAAKLPATLSGDNLYVRLADMIITWNVIQHFHPYYSEWITNWDADLRESLAACYKSKTAQDFRITLSTLLAKLRDGHVSVFHPDIRDTAWLPIKWAWVEQQAVIVRVLDPRIQLQPGDVVTAINGIPAADYINNISRTVSGGTLSAVMRKTLAAIVQGPKDSTLLLSVKSAGKGVRKVKLPFTMSTADYNRFDPATSAYQRIDSGIIYVNLLLQPWEGLDKKLPELSKAAAVIFDLRGRPKDENGIQILSYLLKQPEHTKWLYQQQIILPDHEKTSWEGSGWNLAPVTPHIGGKVIFLTNGYAGSYAESVMGYVKGQHLATIVGQPTAGANGDVIEVSLPGGYTFSFTGLKATNHDGSQHYMKGVQPDITQQQTIKGIREGRDELLDKAIEICK